LYVEDMYLFPDSNKDFQKCHSIFISFLYFLSKETENGRGKGYLLNNI